MKLAPSKAGLPAVLLCVLGGMGVVIKSVKNTVSSARLNVIRGSCFFNVPTAVRGYKRDHADGVLSVRRGNDKVYVSLFAEDYMKEITLKSGAYRIGVDLIYLVLKAQHFYRVPNDFIYCINDHRDKEDLKCENQSLNHRTLLSNYYSLSVLFAVKYQ